MSLIKNKLKFNFNLKIILFVPSIILLVLAVSIFNGMLHHTFDNVAYELITFSISSILGSMMFVYSFENLD